MNLSRISFKHLKGKHLFSTSLHLKIIAGYAFIIGILVTIAIIMRCEANKLAFVEAGEQQRNTSRGLIYQTFGKLLDLTIPGELLPLWDKTDFERYHDDTRSIIGTLNELKGFYPDSSQCSRIDSACLLLKEKKMQIGNLYESLAVKSKNRMKRGGMSASHTDSLKSKNQELNCRLDHIIHDFERVAIKQTKSEYELRYKILYASFRTLSICMIIAFLIVALFYFLIHRDIRKRRDYRRKLETANQNNQLLLALHRRSVQSILHDLRSPLGIISGYAELAKGETDGPKRETQIDSILSSSQHILALTETLLEYYKLDMGGEQTSPVAFFPDEFMQELERDFRPMAENKGLSLVTHALSEEIALSGDRERLYRIAANLISNAVKFTIAGTITVSMKYQEGMLHLQIQDTGIGMDAEGIKRIFNAFERLDNTGEAAGFGLGLPITDGLVKLLGGTIRVESKPGVGSLFTVILPMSPTILKKERKAIVQNNSLQYPLRILAIDDDPMQQILMREMLHRQNITCNCCSRADEVMEQLRSEQYDLLITDIQMPETDGFMLLEMLRESDIPQAKTISVLAMTARIDLYEEDYIEKGFAGCLFKPVTLSTLITTITGQDCLLANGEDVSFSLVLQEENNPPEMLELFISETRKNMTILRNAIEQGDAEALSVILHKLTPLWETLGVYISHHPEPKEYPTIFRQGEWLVRRATQLYHSLTNNKMEHEKDTDY